MSRERASTFSDRCGKCGRRHKLQGMPCPQSPLPRRRRFTVVVDRDICFRTTHEVVATSEEAAKELALKARREATDWFAGDVANDWIRVARIERRMRKGGK